MNDNPQTQEARQKAQNLLDNLEAYAGVSGQVWNDQARPTVRALAGMGQIAEDILIQALDGTSEDRQTVARRVLLFMESPAAKWPPRQTALAEVTRLRSAASDPTVVSEQVALFHSDNTGAFRQAAHNLLAQGEAGINALVEAMSADSFYVRTEALIALGELKNDPQILPVFLQALNDEDMEVRRLTAQILQQTILDDPQIGSALAQAVAAEKKTGVQREMLTALWGHPHEAAIPGVLDALRKEKVQPEALACLSRMAARGWLGADAIPPLVAILDDLLAVDMPEAKHLIRLTRIGELLGMIDDPAVEEPLRRLVDWQPRFPIEGAAEVNQIARQTLQNRA